MVALERPVDAAVAQSCMPGASAEQVAAAVDVHGCGPAFQSAPLRKVCVGVGVERAPGQGQQYWLDARHVAACTPTQQLRLECAAVSGRIAHFGRCLVAYASAPARQPFNAHLRDAVSCE